jgi:hypothetical protein
MGQLEDIPERVRSAAIQIEPKLLPDEDSAADYFDDPRFVRVFKD